MILYKNLFRMVLNHFRNTHIKIKLLISIAFFLTSTISFAQNPAQKYRIAQKSNTSKLSKLKSEYSKKRKKEKAAAIKAAKKNGWKITKKLPNGGRAELQKLSIDGTPMYYQTYNTIAAKSTRTDHLNSSGSLDLSLDGQDMTIHVWDGGQPFVTHPEFEGANANSRITIKDASDLASEHANHVTGTLIANGTNPLAKGMASQARADSYDWNDDLAEVSAAAAEGMLISNHSYGFVSEGLNNFYFGAYVQEAKEWDEILYNAPYYLMVVAAGNDGEHGFFNNDPLEGNSNYDKLISNSVVKNNLVVASAANATVDTHGNILSPVTSSVFTSQGPTDDYRIKPDISGNGEDVFSTFLNIIGNRFEYYEQSGTSMASPNVSGSLLLLQQHYQNLNGDFMKAATLKGIALHTADNIGAPGPDSVSGWGLLNAKAAAETITNVNDQSKIEELTLSSGESYTITVNSDGVNPLLASISWTDPAGIVQTSTNDTTPILVNDLDITVSNETTTYMPYKLTSVSSNDTGNNTVDPYERVDVANASGMYTITVTHKGTLTNNSQDYSLIITGIKESSSICNATTPNGIEINNVDGISATLSWSSTALASYEIRYREMGTSNWFTQSVASPLVTINELSPNTTYEIQVKSLCSEVSVSEYSPLITFGTTELLYCEFSTLESTIYGEYISNVTLGNINNTSEFTSSVYGDYTSLSTALTTNESYSISITPEWLAGAFDEGYAVWIDYNQNQSFDDEGELIWNQSPTQETPVIGTFTVPSNALNGPTRMRVSMKFNEVPSSCEDFQLEYYGEVEDYTVVITNNAFIDTEAPTIPTGLTASKIETTSLDLSWTPAIDNVEVVGYEIFQDGVSIGNTTSTSLSISDLTPNTLYAFSILAFDAAGNNSERSTSLNVNTTGETFTFTPDPNKKYYVDSAHFNVRLASTGDSEDAYTTTATTTGADVEWKFVEKASGTWHLERAAGGSRPRLRTDLTENADIRPSSFSGTFTYFTITEGFLPNSYFLTYIDAPNILHNRLQIDNTRSVKMASENQNGTWESFRITEIPELSDNTLIIQENEAGFCFVSGSIDANNAGYTGTGFANTENAIGNGINWSIDGESGLYTFTWRYYASTSNRPADLIINGETVSSNIQFNTTEAWNTWVNTASITVNLNSGLKDILLKSTTNLGLSSIDYLQVTGPDISEANCLIISEKIIAQKDPISSINLYPNPVYSTLNIETIDENFTEVIIFSLEGSIIQKTHPIEDSFSIDTSLLTPGVYLAKFISEKSITTKKFIKE